MATIQSFPRHRCADADLVEAVARGDHDALRAIWVRYSSVVRATLIATLGADAVVEDLTQEVFLGLFRRAARLRNPKALKSYLLGSAVRIAAFERRTRARRNRWLDLLAREPDRPRVRHPDVEPRDAVRVLRGILDSLPERPRAAFVLRYVQDLSPTEVAEALAVSAATAKRAIARGRERVLLHAGREPALREYLNRLEGREP